MVIGITGGVGCGKSTVLRILEKDFGCFVIEADKTAHLLMRPGQEVYAKIVEAFGDEIIGLNEEIDRAALGTLVFADPQKLALLNGIVHPAVKMTIKNQIKQVINSQKDAIIVIEAALLIEDHYEELCDELWYIYTRDDIRYERLRKSRGYTDDKIDKIVKNQLSEAEFRRHCRRVIDNSLDFEQTYRQIQVNMIQISEEQYGRNK